RYASAAWWPWSRRRGRRPALVCRSTSWAQSQASPWSGRTAPLPDTARVRLVVRAARRCQPLSPDPLCSAPGRSRSTSSRSRRDGAAGGLPGGVASVCALLAGGRGTWVAVEEMAVGAEGCSGDSGDGGRGDGDGASGAEADGGRGDAVGGWRGWSLGWRDRWGAGRDGGGWVLVVMAGIRGGGRGSC